VRDDGSLSCWGEPELGQLDAPAGTFVQVGAGEGVACALAPTGKVWCWGQYACQPL
jgi:hypothetical protein